MKLTAIGMLRDLATLTEPAVSPPRVREPLAHIENGQTIQSTTVANYHLLVLGDYESNHTWLVLFGQIAGSAADPIVAMLRFEQ